MKILTTLCTCVYLVVIPYLEFNTSHVFNELWPPHARFHEVWQLISNILIGLIALWLVWVRRQLILASMLNLAVMLGVLISSMFSDFYGGSIVSGNIDTQIFGISLPIFIGITVLLVSVYTIAFKVIALNK